MPLSVIEIQREAERLTSEDKERLIGFLIASLEQPDEGAIEAEWAEECLRRSQEIHDGRVSAAPADEAFARIRRTLK
jgi:putative addiction module component (TIGR02574 family)